MEFPQRRASAPVRVTLAVAVAVAVAVPVTVRRAVEGFTVRARTRGGLAVEG